MGSPITGLFGLNNNWPADQDLFQHRGVEYYYVSDFGKHRYNCYVPSPNIKPCIQDAPPTIEDTIATLIFGEQVKKISNNTLRNLTRKID
jgi:hypothetical protein